MPDSSDMSDRLVKMWDDKGIELACPVCKNSSFNMMEHAEIEIPFGMSAAINGTAYAMLDQGSYAVNCANCGFVMSFRRRVVDETEPSLEPEK